MQLYESSAPLGQTPNIIVITNWAIDLVNNLEATGHIQNHHAVEQIIKEIQKFRGGVGILSCYDWISIPLGYTQVSVLLILMWAFFSKWNITSNFIYLYSVIVYKMERPPFHRFRCKLLRNFYQLSLSFIKVVHVENGFFESVSVLKPKNGTFRNVNFCGHVKFLKTNLDKHGLKVIFNCSLQSSLCMPTFWPQSLPSNGWTILPARYTALPSASFKSSSICVGSRLVPSSINV